MAVNLSPVGGVAAQFFTNSGAVLTGGKLYTYAAGTTTPQASYTTSQGNVPWTNPIVLDAAGRVPSGGEIWLTDGLIYKFVLKDSNDVLIATYDNITGINSNAVAYTNQQEIVTATAGQTVFNLGINYQPGTNSLSVFVDGVNQYGPGAQYSYVETDSNTVTFNAGLHVGAEVKFTTTQQQAAGAVDASQVSYDPPFTGSAVTNVEAKLAQYVSVKDFGAVGNGMDDDTNAIQLALDTCPGVFFPAGTYKISSSLKLNSYNFLTGVYQQSIISSTHNGPAIAGKNVTPASGTNVRVYYGGGSNLSLEGPGVGFGAGIGLDMRGCTGFKWQNILIKNYDTGVVHGSGYNTYYNEYRAVDIVTVNTGYYSTDLGNENLVVGGRVNDCVTGTIDSDNSHNKYIGLAIEVFTYGHRISGPAAVSTNYISSRLEGGTTGILINSTAQDTVIISPHYQSVTTEVDDSGLRTSRFDSLGLKVVGGSLVRTVIKQTVNLAIGPISANTLSQVNVTLTVPTSASTSILPGDAVFVNLPSSWPATLIAGLPLIGGTNYIYLPVYNVSASPVTVAAADYVVTVVKAT